MGTKEVERNAKRSLRICTSSTRRQRKVKLVDKMGSTTGSSGSLKQYVEIKQITLIMLMPQLLIKPIVLVETLLLLIKIKPAQLTKTTIMVIILTITPNAQSV